MVSKRFQLMFGFLTCLAFILSASPIHALQSGDYTYTLAGNPLTATITQYRGSGGSVAIPNKLGGYPVSGIGEAAFYDCYSLTSVSIPANVTSIGYIAFSGCQSLTSVSIPVSGTTIGDYAFVGCFSITSVSIPAKVTKIGDGPFSDCGNLMNITVDANNSAYCSVDGVLFDKKKTTLIQFPGGKAGSYIIPSSVSSIGESAFSGCYSLTSVTIPDSVISIKDWTFSGCDDLVSVTIPDSVTTIGECAFQCCYSITSVTIPDSVTTIGDMAFSECYSLTSVTIPNHVTSIGESAFIGCESLTSVIIGSGSIGECAFESLSSLTSVVIGNGVTNIGGSAFLDCESLTSVTIGNGVVSIGDGAFMGCESLTSVTIPASVTSIKDSAFEFCFLLTCAYFLGNAPTVGYDIFDGVAEGFRIWYASNATGWSNPWHGYPTATLSWKSAASFTSTHSESGKGSKDAYTVSGVFSFTTSSSVTPLDIFDAESWMSINMGGFSFRGQIKDSKNKITAKSGTAIFTAKYGNTITYKWDAKKITVSVKSKLPVNAGINILDLSAESTGKPTGTLAGCSMAFGPAVWTDSIPWSATVKVDKKGLRSWTAKGKATE